MARMMTRLLRSFLGLLLMSVAISGSSQEIQKSDPGLNQIVPANAKLERVATGFNKWTEGPAWTRDGSLRHAAFISLRDDNGQRRQPASADPNNAPATLDPNELTRLCLLGLH